MSHCDTVAQDSNDCVRKINMRPPTKQFIRIGESSAVGGGTWRACSPAALQSGTEPTEKKNHNGIRALKGMRFSHNQADFKFP